MTSLLEQAFKQAAQLPEETQNEIAAQLLADMESKWQWGEGFNKAPDKLERLAEKALEEYKAGNTIAAGFDAL